MRRPDPTPSEGPDPYGNPDAEPEWLRIDWREHLRTAKIGGTEINYVERGTGDRAVVFVHGLSGSWQNWLEQIPDFSREHRAIALDLPGFGASPMPRWPITVETYGRLLHDFCEFAEAQGAVVVGNSMGGFVAAEAAGRRPSEFSNLVLVSAAGISSAEMRREPAEAVGRVMAATAPIGLRLQEQALRRPGLRRLAFRQIVHRPLELRPELLWEQFHHGAAKPGFLPALTNLVGYDMLHRLEDVEMPSLIVWGREDRIVPAGDAVGYGERLRNSRTVIMAETGHLPQLERPVRFNRILDAFLRE